MDPTTTRIRRTTSSGGGSGTILLEKYQLNHLLGRGSFAKVYHATPLHPTATPSTAVAIKVIDKAATVDADMEPRIIREVSAMRRLQDHPNILKLHEVMATKTKIYLVMELAHGGELLTKLAQHRRFSEPTARKYFHQLISALQFSHHNGVFHRDIKPQNLLLDSNGLLKITDFGLSALTEHKKDDGLIHTACGTPSYTAPEVVYRKGYDGGKADAWSCGVLLYCFLVGSLPFDDGNLSNMYRAMHRREFKIPDWVSKSGKNLICKLMDPNPVTRLSLDEVMNHSWFKKSSSLKKSSSRGELRLDSEFLGQKEMKYNMSQVNAFDLISMSSGLDLSPLFEAETNNRKEMRFTCGVEAGEIVDRIVKVGGELGYIMKKGKGGGLGLVKGNVALIMEILEVALGLWLVELKVVAGGVEFGDLHREEFKLGLGDFVLSWHTAVS